MSEPVLVDVDTPEGPARAHLHVAAEPAGAILLGHGAGGGVAAPDLLTARDMGLELGWSVALVEQPYRVAGRSSSPPAPRLDGAWLAITEHLSSGELAGLPLVSGGRSAGARVACRTATATGVVGVLCLAFPLQPPMRKDGTMPPSRLPELKAVTVPLLVVQGTNDRFGMPRSGGSRKVVRVKGDHGLKSDREAIGTAIREWIGSLPCH